MQPDFTTAFHCNRNVPLQFDRQPIITYVILNCMHFPFSRPMFRNAKRYININNFLIQLLTATFLFERNFEKSLTDTHVPRNILTILRSLLPPRRVTISPRIVQPSFSKRRVFKVDRSKQIELFSRAMFLIWRCGIQHGHNGQVR